MILVREKYQSKRRAIPVAVLLLEKNYLLQAKSMIPIAKITVETKTNKEEEATAKRKSELTNRLLPDDQEIDEWNLDSEQDPKMIKITKHLKKELKDKAWNLFLKFKDEFAWEHTYLKGVDPEVCQHRIPLKLDARPVRLQRFRMNPNYAKKVKEEIDNLLKVGFITKVESHDWLFPIVVVPKKNGKLRVYVDYKKLNVKTIKDPFPLPFIDTMLNEITRHEMLTIKRVQASMASFRKPRMNADKSAVVVAALILLAMSCCSWELVAGQPFCPTGDLVYPYWSLCTNPAKYDESFSIIGASSGEGLAPLGSYVVMSSTPATYQLAYNSSAETRSSVAQGENFTVVNAATGKSLAWGEIDGEYLLIESDSEAATFQLLQDDTAALPCPLVYGARCAAYNLISGDGSGKGLSVSGSSIKLQSADLTAFMVTRSSSSLSKDVIATVV
ncbi:hypothetical protein L7F22_052523 [Adiantum nelumboides]|nr:hypothetical protein [Adiantum nelumboides]